MAIGRDFGIGRQVRAVGGIVQAPPTTPDSGSGGPGVLRAVGETARGAGISFGPALSEVSDVTTGRVTLGMVNFTILVMLGFYWWTRSAQGGG